MDHRMDGSRGMECIVVEWTSGWMDSGAKGLMIQSNIEYQKDNRKGNF